MLTQPSLNYTPVVSSGIDYLTCTKPRKSSLSGFQTLADYLISTERSYGNFVVPWQGLGYQGFKCGSVACGSREDGYLVRASSEAAAEYWKDILSWSLKATRCDLQVTVKIDSDVGAQISNHRKEMLAFMPSSGRAPVVRWVRDSIGGFTLYSGSRVSESFGRIYDKWAESRADMFQSCVRYEVEFKKDAARSIASYVFNSSSAFEPIIPRVSQFFLNRGVSFPVMPPCGELKFMPPRLNQRASPQDDRKILQWLATQVGPSVQKLLRAGLRDEVLIALGLGES